MAWERGAEVYRNAGCSGKGDLVLKFSNQLIECDVKQMTWCNRNNDFRHTHAVRPGITPIVVHPATRQVRWVKGREPSGLENFWN